MVCSLCFGIFFQLWYMVMETKSRTVCEKEVQKIIILDQQCIALPLNQETFIDLFYPRLLECIMKHSV